MEIKQFDGCDPRSPVGVDRDPEMAPPLSIIQVLAAELSTFDQVRLFGDHIEVARRPDLEVRVEVVYDDNLTDLDLGGSSFSGDREVVVHTDDLEAGWFEDFDSEKPIDVTGPDDETSIQPRTLRYVLTFAVLITAACIGVVV